MTSMPRHLSWAPMRILILSLLVAGLAAAIPFDTFDYADGQDRSAADYSGQPVLVLYFCSH